MVTAEIRIIDDNGNILGTYNQCPDSISYKGLTTSYNFRFKFVTLDEDDLLSNIKEVKDGKNSTSDL